MKKIVGLIVVAFLSGLYGSVSYAVESADPDKSALQLSVSSLTNRIIVKYKSDSPMDLNGLSQNSVDALVAHSGQPMRALRRMATGAHVMQLDRLYSRADIDAMIKRLNSHPEVEYAEADLMMKPLFVPNDTFYGAQWHYYETTGGINLESAWDVTSGAGAVVAVLDTGYRPHVDLVANILPGYDMISDAFVGNDGNGRDSDARDPGDFVSAGQCGGGDPAQDESSSWHGTHVSGTVAAVTNNSTGVAGVAFSAKVVPVRVLGRCGGFTSDIADGIIWAAGGSVSGVPANSNPANVINMSLGGGGSCGSTTQNAINIARSLGTTVVVAAGNSNVNAANATPANCNGVVAVAATNRSGGKSYFSNFGSVVDVAAPGGDLRFTAADGIASTLNAGSTTPGADNYVYYQGTSMSSPHVAAVVALLYAESPSITPDEVETILKESARSFPAACSQCGTGIVDATAALAALSDPPEPPTGGGFIIDNISGSRSSWQRTTVDIPAGTGNLTVSISGGSGDADLYVRFGSQPTTRRYDCRPYLNGNNETCSVNNPSAGTWHIGIRGYTAYSGVTLEVSYE
jgi:serine protease